MTNSNSSGGTTLVNPAGESKRSTNEAIESSAEEEKIEGLLINEEERNMMAHDEEITSEEEPDRDTEERRMLTVALVKSVVETKQDSGDEKRYGLRKRRRPTGEDLRLLEHNQSSKDGGLARSVKAAPPDPADTQVEDQLVQGDPSDREVHAPGDGTAEDSKPKAPVAEPEVAAATPNPPLLANSTVADDHDTNISIGGQIVGEKDNKPSASAPAKSQTPKPPAQLKNPSAKPAPQTKAESPANVPFISSSSTVPNPLSAIPIPSPTMSMHSSKATHSESMSAAVPCPLPAAAVDEKPDIPVIDSSDKRKVTISEPASRSRAFSIDLDLGQFDITGDGNGDGEGDLPLSGGGRNRAFSFECFAFGINADEPLPPLGGQDNDSISTGRPRGDSIIFDPSSFQDGGIHEQNALEKARLTEGRKEAEQSNVSDAIVTADVPVSQPAATVADVPPAHPGAKITSSLLAGSSDPAAVSQDQSQMQPPAPVTSYTTTTTTATTTTTTTTMLPPAAAAATTTTFSMDLLNKEGRIGIYLPEARKARIARFHEKRARRIWRKRIKYDCRKKLADSRPRIKGRFVKRSDMEDE